MPSEPALHELLTNPHKKACLNFVYPLSLHWGASRNPLPIVSLHSSCLMLSSSHFLARPTKALLLSSFTFNSSYISSDFSHIGSVVPSWLLNTSSHASPLSVLLFECQERFQSSSPVTCLEWSQAPRRFHREMFGEGWRSCCSLVTLKNRHKKLRYICQYHNAI